jgi:hypothetical protein
MVKVWGEGGEGSESVSGSFPVYSHAATAPKAINTSKAPADVVVVLSRGMTGRGVEAIEEVMKAGVLTWVK